jgi:hypothetical protein
MIAAVHCAGRARAMDVMFPTGSPRRDPKLGFWLCSLSTVEKFYVDALYSRAATK